MLLADTNDQPPELDGTTAAEADRMPTEIEVLRTEVERAWSADGLACRQRDEALAMVESLRDLAASLVRAYEARESGGKYQYGLMARAKQMLDV